MVETFPTPWAAVVPLALLFMACESDRPPAHSGRANTQSLATPQSSSDLEISNPDWPAATQIDQRVLNELTPQARARVATAPVPALVPNQIELVKVAVITTGQHFYAFSSNVPGLTVSLHATRAAHRYPHIKPAVGDRTLRGQKGFISNHEGINTASWIEREVAYTFELECAHYSDPRCQSEQYLIEQVESLVYVGGVGGQP